MPSKSKSVTLSVRTTPEVKERLAQLMELLSQRLGTSVTQVQALEMAISLALGAEMAMQQKGEDA